MFTTQAIAGSGLQVMNSNYVSASLIFYSGQYPGSPEYPTGYVATNTTLATFTISGFSNAIYSTDGLMVTSGTFYQNPVTPTASGVATFARAEYVPFNQQLSDYLVGMAWEPNLTIVPYQYIVAGSGTYISQNSGVTASAGIGPTGSGTGIQDGTVQWNFAYQGATDIMLTSTLITTGTPLTMPAYWHTLAAT